MIERPRERIKAENREFVVRRERALLALLLVILGLRLLNNALGPLPDVRRLGKERLALQS